MPDFPNYLLERNDMNDKPTDKPATVLKFPKPADILPAESLISITPPITLEQAGDIADLYSLHISAQLSLLELCIVLRDKMRLRVLAYNNSTHEIYVSKLDEPTVPAFMLVMNPL